MKRRVAVQAETDPKSLIPAGGNLLRRACQYLATWLRIFKQAPQNSIFSKDRDMKNLYTDRVFRSYKGERHGKQIDHI